MKGGSRGKGVGTGDRESVACFCKTRLDSTKAHETPRCCPCLLRLSSLRGLCWIVLCFCPFTFSSGSHRDIDYTEGLVFLQRPQPSGGSQEFSHRLQL